MPPPAANRFRRPARLLLLRVPPRHIAAPQLRARHPPAPRPAAATPTAAAIAAPQLRARPPLRPRAQLLLLLRAQLLLLLRAQLHLLPRAARTQVVRNRAVVRVALTPAPAAAAVRHAAIQPAVARLAAATQAAATDHPVPPSRHQLLQVAARVALRQDDNNVVG